MTDSMLPRVIRAKSAGRRVLMMFLIGAVVSGVAAFFWFWVNAVVLGWAAACLAYTLWVWVRVWKMDPEQTREHATVEDPSRGISDVLVLFASVASLAAVGVVIVQASSAPGAERGLLAGFAVASVALSWFLIHTLYTLHYARMYFAEPVGGIDFNQVEPPQYTDFAYLSFDLGMTFQVADTTLRSTDFRKEVLKHTLLSYLFGSVILATTINLVAGLSG